MKVFQKYDMFTFKLLIEKFDSFAVWHNVPA